MTSPEVKTLLTENTQRAVKDGAFGLPYYVGTSHIFLAFGLDPCDWLRAEWNSLNAIATCPGGKTECFWGFDHINQVALHLGLDTLRSEKKDLQAWKAML